MEQLSNDSVYADPVRQVQEQLYDQLIAIREGFYQTLTVAVKEVSSVKAGGSAEPAKGGDAGSSAEAKKLRSEN